MTFILRIFLYFFLIGSILCWSEEDQAYLDNYIENTYLGQNDIPGLIATLVVNGTVVMTKGYGYKNVESSSPTDAHTLMAIGSNSKGITGLVVAKTLHELFPELGPAVLDTPIRVLYPDGNFTFSDRYRSESMSFRDLLSHRHCVSSPDLNMFFGSIQALDEQIYRTRYHPEVCPFRSGMSYNNAYVSLAGDLVALIKGTSFVQLLMDFMREVGMEDASFIDADGGFISLGNMSSGYYYRDKKMELFSSKLLRRAHTIIGGGGILASATDMAAYIKLHLNKGKVGERQVIPENVMDWVYQIANPADIGIEGRKPNASNGVFGYYGYSLGFQHWILDGWATVYHGGYWPPFFSEVLIMPDVKEGLFLAINGAGLEAVLDLSTTILNMLNVPPEPASFLNIAQGFKNEFNGILKPTGKTFVAKKRASNKSEDLIGLYGHPVHGEMTIEIGREPWMLKLNFGEFGIAELLPLPGKPLVYLALWKTDINQHFFNIPIVLDFSYEDAVVMLEEVFLKNRDLGSFPVIPWSPDSCSPSPPSKHVLFSDEL